MANPALYEPMQGDKARIMVLSMKKRSEGLTEEEEAELKALLSKIQK